jgi:hypothetical protein
MRVYYIISYVSQRGRANRKSFEVEVANADSLIKDVTRVHYQGPVQLYARDDYGRS